MIFQTQVYAEDDTKAKNTAVILKAFVYNELRSLGYKRSGLYSSNWKSLDKMIKAIIFSHAASAENDDPTHPIVGFTLDCNEQAKIDAELINNKVTKNISGVKV